MAQRYAIPIDVRLMGWAANGLFVVALAMGGGAVLAWVAQHPSWSLVAIVVVGDVRHQNEVKLRSHLGTRLEGTFLTVNLQQVQHLIEGVPWVRSARVQREFPNRLRVVIEEHEAVAWWGEAGGGKLINRYGEIFEAAADEPAHQTWSALSGPAYLSHQLYRVYQTLGPVLGRIDRRLVRLELNARGSWSAVLDGGTRMEMGRGQPELLIERVQTFVDTVPTLMAHYGPRDIETVDLRYPNGYALRIRGVSTLIAPPPDPPPAPPVSPASPATAASPTVTPLTQR
jgi:cell division protein FtsQ